MAQHSDIEWTDATWNPVRGCSRVSAGCGGPNHEGGCYAEKIAARFSDPGQAYHGLAVRTPHGGRWTGEVRLIEEQLTVPLRWRKPRRIFVNSMSDLFHENLPDTVIDKVFAVMALCPQHTFQILTKRSARMREYLGRRRVAGDVAIFTAINDIPWQLGDRKGALEMPLPNVWLGVSVEDQAAADLRIPDLMATPAAVRFLSCEPLLGPVHLGYLRWPGGDTRPRDGFNALVGARYQNGEIVDRLPKIDQVICGGESGPRKRPTNVAWHRSLRDQCAAAGLAFFEKQIDKVQPIPEDLMIRQFPKEPA